MKKIIALITLSLVIVSSPLLAQKGVKGKKMDPAKRLEMMKEQLSLKEDQVSKLKEIYDAEKERLKAMKAKKKSEGENFDKEAAKKEMKEAKAAKDKKIKEILTEEQYKKLKEIKQNRPKKAEKKGEKK